MHNITLIATGHKERGMCNSNELYKIIERIAPEIIFEEVPPQKIAGVYNGSIPGCLESQAIKRYIHEHPIDHFPVDKDVDQIIENRLRKDFKELDNIFSYHSPEYIHLSAQHAFLTERDGFPYLNSYQCEEILERRIFLEKEIVRTINHEQLSQKHKGWLEYHDMRENEMVKNIYKYSALHKYNFSLFLVGAEHRKPIMDKLPEYEKNNKPEINWIFNYFK